MAIGSAIIITAALATSQPAAGDDQAYRRALQSRSPSACVEIQNQAMRQRCRVELGDNPANCNTISDYNQRELCKARAKRSRFDV